MRKAGALAMLKYFMLFVLCGWVLAWLVRPTKFWNSAWLHVETSISTQAYGRAGADILFFTVPLLLLAVLGSIYLKFKGTEVSCSLSEKFRVHFASFPVFVKGPFGFVSVKELLVALTIWGIFVWALSNYVANDFSDITPKKLKKSQDHHLWQYKLEKIGIRLGFCGQLFLALLFLPVTRGLRLLQLIGVHFDLAVKYHMWLANTTVIIYMLHFLCFFTVWGTQSRLRSEFSTWQSPSRPECSNLAGLLALAIAIIMRLTSISPIRRKQFEVFYYTHQAYALFMVFMLMHVAYRHLTLVLGSMFLVIVDRFLRFCQSVRTTKVLSARILPCQAIELNLPKHPGFEYSSTSAIFLKIPLVSQMEWHPFTIISSPIVHKHKISVLIKCQGGWTQKLYDIISTSEHSDSKSTTLSAAVEGPYGPGTNYFMRYKYLILIAGGSGITPFLSILQHVFSQNLGINIVLVFSMKRKKDIFMLSLISQSLLQQALERGLLKLKLYITQEQEFEDPKSLNRLSDGIRIKHFENSHTLSLPPLLGSESNAWKAAMTSMSFGAFLLLLGLFNSLLINLGDDKSKNSSPTWQRAFIMVGAAIVGIGTTVCVMSMWRWKSYKIVADVGKFSIDVGEMFFQDESDGVENSSLLFHHAYVQYGRRPDFRDILSTSLKDMEGSSVGILVCGPKGMQEALEYDFKAMCFSGNFKTKMSVSLHRVGFVL